MTRDGERRSPGDGDADLDFFGTTIKVRNPALAKLLSDDIAQDVVVVERRPVEPADGVVHVSIGQDASPLDSSRDL
jgi:hypothetical protein